MQELENDRELQYCTIFGSIKGSLNKTERNNDISIRKAILDKEKIVKRLYLYNLGVPQFSNYAKPLSLKKIEKGLQRLLFGKDGELLQHFGFLRKEFMQKERKKQEDLNKKIETGPLTYLFLKENEDNADKRLTELQKNKLKMSNNYAVHGGKDLNLIENIILTEDTMNSSNGHIHSLSQNLQRTLTGRNKRKSVLKGKKMESIYKTHASTTRSQLNEWKMNLLTTTPQRSRNAKNTLHTRSSIQEHEKQKSFFTLRNGNMKSKDRRESKLFLMTETSCKTTSSPYKSYRTETRPFTSTKKSRFATKTLLLSKAAEFANNQEILDQRLYRIIDEAHIEQRNTVEEEKIKDLAKVLDLTVKKKNKKGEAKEMVIQAIKIKDDYTLMDRDKAEMLKLSDDITKMTDEAALLYADRIQDAYYKKSDKIADSEYNVNPIKEKQKLERYTKLRNKINNGTYLMKKMHFNLHIDKQIMSERLHLNSTLKN